MRQSSENWLAKGFEGSDSKRYNLASNSRMKELKMVNMNLKFVTANMFCTSLKRIDLSHNKLAKLPDEITEISDLTHLKVDHNLIETLPDHIWKM